MMTDKIYRCEKCGDRYTENNSVSCSVAHSDDQCCHYGEVKMPAADVWKNETDDQRDEIIDLVNKLPSQFFGDNYKWRITARRLADVLDIAENGKADREILDSVCELLNCSRTQVYTVVKGLIK